MWKCFLNAFVCSAFFYLPGGACGEGLLDDVVATGRGQPALLTCSLSSTPGSLARATWAKETRKGISQVFAVVTQCQDTDIRSCNISLIRPEKFALGGTLIQGFTLLIQQEELAARVFLTMLLRQVSRDDEGIYLCTAVLRGSEGSIQRRIQLAISVPPTEVHIRDVNNGSTLMNMDLLYIVSQQRRSLNCTVTSPSNPPATITWIVDDVNTSIIYKQKNWPVGDNTSLMTSSRQADLIPNINNDGKVISCVVEHPGMLDPLQVGVTLRVRSLSPTELGIKAVYDYRRQRVDITRPVKSGGPLPSGLCFQLVHTTNSRDSADPAEISIDCVGVGGAVSVPLGWSLENTKVLTNHNNVYSFPSEIYFNGSKTSLNSKVTITLTTVTVVIIVAVIVTMVYWKKKKQCLRFVDTHKSTNNPCRETPPPAEAAIDSRLERLSARVHTRSSRDYYVIADEPRRDEQGCDSEYYALHHDYGKDIHSSAEDGGYEAVKYSKKIYIKAKGSEMESDHRDRFADSNNEAPTPRPAALPN